MLLLSTLNSFLLGIGVMTLKAPWAASTQSTWSVVQPKEHAEPDPKENCTVPPRTAICIAGAARGFSTILTMRLLRNMIKGLRVAPRLFLLLKAVDHPKNDPFQKRHFPKMFVGIESIKTALREAWLRRITAEAIILNGSGSIQPSVIGVHDGSNMDGSDMIVEQSDDTWWASYRAKSCPAMRQHWHKSNSEERLIVFHLSLQWCAAAIDREEQRRAAAFDLVAFARPDLAWWKPLPRFCTWQWNTTMLRQATRSAVDRAWIAPRKYMGLLFGQAAFHRDCTVNDKKNLFTCCEASEDLLLYTLRVHKIPTVSVEMDTTFIRGPPWSNQGHKNICSADCDHPASIKTKRYYAGVKSLEAWSKQLEAKCREELALMVAPSGNGEGER